MTDAEDQDDPIDFSMADALSMVEASQLPIARKRHWACSLRAIGGALDHPPERLSGRWLLIGPRIRKLHPARVGLQSKTLQNHRSNAKAALLWCSGEKGIAGQGVPILPVWAKLRARINSPTDRYHLTGPIRFCSARNILPTEVSQAVIERYFRQRQVTGQECGPSLKRKVASAWNRRAELDPDWPQVRLEELPLKSDGLIPWEWFPETLRKEVEAALASKRKIPPVLKGIVEPQGKASTSRTRVAELQALARRAVAAGYPIESLRGLGDLLNPDLLEQVFEKQFAERRNRNTIADLAWRFCALARDTGCLSPEALARLKEMRTSTQHHRDPGMTEKNQLLVRALLNSDAWSRVLGLPEKLMKEARRIPGHAPQRAASQATMAVAIAILTFAPVRIANLINIKIGRHLQRYGDRYVFVVPPEEVKNKVLIECPFDTELTALIDEYVRDFRPKLPGAELSDYLFPSVSGSHRHPNNFGTRLANTVYKHVGLRVTAHQFRHAAGAIILKHNPAAHGLVQSLLGHKRVETTIRYYAALESLSSSIAYHDLLRSRVRKNLSAGSPWHG
jgi:Phage integrase family